MNKLLKLSLIIFLFGFVSACNKDSMEEKTKYESGIFILNEGPFMGGVGTIDFYAPDSNKVYQEVYQTENEGSPIGSILQSMEIIDDKAYFVSNLGGKVMVADSKSLLYQDEINALSQPRYVIEGKNGELYISQWGDGSSGAIQVVDSKTNTITKTIETGGGPESMVLHDNNLYVALSGGYNRDSMLLIINPIEQTISKEIPVGDNPIDLQLDRNQELWVLCTGYTDWGNPSNSTQGKLVKISNNEIVLSYDVPNGAHDLSINRAGDVLYFLSFDGVYAQDITATSFIAERLIEGSFYAAEVHPKTGDIYLGDAKDYASNGTVLIYNETGQKITEFEAGIIPGSFYFTF